MLIAANRDEMLSRSWQAPGRHWSERPEVVAGLDVEAGGSWLGINDHGVVAAVLNRVGSLGAEAGKRSRGELVLEALDHAEAARAAEALAAINPHAYRSFNLIVADCEAAFWLRHRGEPGSDAAVEPFALPPGLSMITAHDRNDLESPRIRDYLERFEAASTPDPDSGDWGGWTELMASRTHDAEDGPLAAMTVDTERGFGTSSSALIALPAPPRELDSAGSEPARKPVFLFAPGAPDRTAYRPLDL